jgi:cation diffusion facilitator CzcD-associated flavoprotein CzcO
MESYQVSEAVFGQPRKLRILIIGCGASGILFAYKLRKHLSDSEFVIYEKNHDVGGTWLENRYPGCACDIPSHAYQYNWAPNPEWNKFYSGSEELWKYFKRVAQDFDIMTNVRLRHRVSGAEWMEDDARWKLSIVKDDRCIITDEGEFLIDASGVLK